MGDAEEFILFIRIMAPLTSAGTARNYLLIFLCDNHRTYAKRHAYHI